MDLFVKIMKGITILLVAAIVAFAAAEWWFNKQAQEPIIVHTDETRFVSAHDYCLDIPGIQDLVNGSVVCDAPKRPRKNTIRFSLLPKSGG